MCTQAFDDRSEVLVPLRHSAKRSVVGLNVGVAEAHL
jgi:hypothetical protein